VPALRDSTAEPPGSVVTSGRPRLGNRFASRRATWPALAAPSIALVGGVVAGFLVLLAHESGNELRAAGELGGPWLVAAFAAGAISRNRWLAALTGFATLLAMLVGYYWLGNLDAGSEIAHTFRFWLVIALVAGPVMGWAGWSWLGARPVGRVASISVLVGCLIAEGVFFWSYGHRTVPVAEVGIAVVFLAFLPRSTRERLLAMVGTVAITVVAAVILALIQATYADLFTLSP
jgi:hypothetical protein